jgi:hypothetical protein
LSRPGGKNRHHLPWEVAMSHEPGRVLEQLLAQHNAIRGFMRNCEDLASRIAAGEPLVDKLTLAIARLRIAFESHNKFEESLLRPILSDSDAFGPARIEQLVTQHISEHSALLAGMTIDTLQAVIADLRHHLEEEERYFVTSRVLRDDTISVEASA